MSDRKGSRYDDIEIMLEDVIELRKEVSKLITTSNKRGREIIELRDSNNEIVLLLRDMKNLVSKEAMQRLDQQISNTAVAKITSLGQTLRSDIEQQLQKALKDQVTPTEVSEGLAELDTLYQQKIGQIEKYLGQLSQQLQQQIHQLREYTSQEATELATAKTEVQELRNTVALLPSENKVQELIGQLRFEIADMKNIYATTEKVQELVTASTLKEERVQELLENYATTEKVQELLTTSTLKEERVQELLENYPTTEKVQELLTTSTLKEERVQELLEKYSTNEKVQELLTASTLKEERVQELLENYATNQKVHQLLEQYPTIEKVRELLASTCLKEERVRELLQPYPTTEKIEALLSTITKNLPEDNPSVTAITPEDLAKLRTEISALSVSREQVIELLDPYLKKEDIHREDMMRQILNLAIDTAMRQERDRAAEFYVSKDTANACYMLRDEFKAIRQIMITRDDLETLGKNELDGLRVEQDTLRRNMVSREQLKMLKGEFEDVRTRCEVLESKLESVSGVLTITSPIPVVTAPPEPSDVASQLTALQQQVASIKELLPETKNISVGSATVKFLKVGDSRFLLSSGFPLTDEEVKFPLQGIELPEIQQATQSNKDYTSTLTPDGYLIFRRVGDTIVNVKRFMFWY